MSRFSFALPALALSVAAFALALAIVTSRGGEAAEPAGAGAGFRVQHLVINSMEVISPTTGCAATGGPFGITGAVGCLSYYAPVHLPDGSRITDMSVIYEDNSAAKDIVVSIADSNLAGTTDGGSDFRVDSSGTPGKVTQQVSGNLAVDNTASHYHLELGLKGDVNLKFYSVLITYETPAFVAGDVNCSGGPNPVDAFDALDILRHVGSLPVSQTPPCPPIGQ